MSVRGMSGVSQWCGAGAGWWRLDCVMRRRTSRISGRDSRPSKFSSAAAMISSACAAALPQQSTSSRPGHGASGSRHGQVTAQADLVTARSRRKRISSRPDQGVEQAGDAGVEDLSGRRRTWRIVYGASGESPHTRLLYGAHGESCMAYGV
jgi:hypothetical protein